MQKNPLANIKGQKPQNSLANSPVSCGSSLNYDKPSKEFAVFIEDDGIGQTPIRMHETLLSLGSSDKGDKPYLIGLFGQGGSSTYATSEYSWCVSRRAAKLLDGKPKSRWVDGGEADVPQEPA